MVFNGTRNASVRTRSVLGVLGFGVLVMCLLLPRGLIAVLLVYNFFLKNVLISAVARS